ncbi:MAG: hypothetical protein LBD47_10235 [Treponema sp.]|jgi:hypothetical protein|nr:hypothetical protein [Treponema sp.]
MAGAHQNDTKAFGQLNFAEQAKSITAQIHSLEMAIKANIKRAGEEDRDSPAKIRIEQVEKFVQRLKKKYGI